MAEQLECERFRCCANRRYLVDGGAEIVWRQSYGDCRLIPSVIAGLVDDCRSFLTIAEHAARICRIRGYSADQQSVIIATLKDCARVGLLQSEASIIAAYRELPCDREDALPIKTIGVVTHERSDGLRRSVTSYAINAKKFGHKVRLRVVDGSENAQVRLENRNVLRRVHERLGVAISYVGMREKIAAERRLTEAGFDKELIRFALFDPLCVGHAAGANRNALLLSTVGERMLSVDDDTVCRTVLGRARSTITISSRFNAAEWKFFRDREELRRSVRFVDEDVILAHSRVLGHSLRSLLQSSELSFGGFDNVDVSHAFMHNLEERLGQVLVTQSGVAGDCGASSPNCYVAAGPETLMRVATAMCAVDRVPRDVLSCADAIIVSDSKFLMSYSIGLDNRSGLIPFFPVQRNQDGVFASALRKCFPESLTCHIPLAVLHDPPETRAFARSQMWSDAGRFRISDIVMLCIESFQASVRRSEPRKRMRALGDHLSEMSSWSDDDFWQALRHLGRAIYGRRLAHAEQQYRSTVSNGNFGYEVDRYRNSLREALLQDDFVTPCDLSPALGPGRGGTLLRQLIGRYGQLLKDWPDIVATVRTTCGEDGLGIMIGSD